MTYQPTTDGTPPNGASLHTPAGLDMSQKVDETEALISADKVVGTAVYNRSGDHLGKIDTIMLGKQSGRVAYSIMAFGGFLGIGERYHPLPWGLLTYDTDLGGYSVDLDADTLRAAPNYTRGEVDEFNYERDRFAIDSYYSGYGKTTGLM